MSFIPRNILVTGGAGFIGSNFVRWLLGRDATVRILTLDALTYAGSLANLAGLPDPDRHVFVHGDICDRPLVERLLREQAIDTLVHFAAESHVDRSISGPGEFIRSNLVGTFTLLDACREYWLGEQQPERAAVAATRRFHHISTDEVYGTLGAQDPAFTEATPYAPNSPYSASKAGADHLVRAYFHTYGLPVTTSNCTNNYGPFQHVEKFIPTIIHCCITGTPIPVYGDGSNIRDWLYVEDHCQGIWRVITQGRPGETYNIGGHNEWRNIDIVRLICRLFDERRPAQAPHEKLITFVTDRPGHDQRYAMDATRMQDELHWRPDTAFAAGIAHTIDWYLAGGGNT